MNGSSLCTSQESGYDDARQMGQVRKSDPQQQGGCCKRELKSRHLPVKLCIRLYVPNIESGTGLLEEDLQ